jgi:hypothetical protein
VGEWPLCSEAAGRDAAAYRVPLRLDGALSLRVTRRQCSASRLILPPAYNPPPARTSVRLREAISQATARG